MEKVLFDELIQSLNEAVSYASGDTSKGRSKKITIADDELEIYKMIYQQLSKLSKENKVKVIKYADSLVQTSV